MKGRMRHRGFSLLELLLVMVVIALAMIAVASGGGHAPKEKADSKALAETLAEELRLARQKAMTKEIPVGVIFPGDEKFPGEECKSPVMQSCYILEGETPRHTRTIDYSKAYPSTYIFIGFWDLASGHGPVTNAQPSTGSNYDTFDVENWGAGTQFKDCRDFALIFTPAGTVRTNKLPNFDCDFHILVNRAVAYEVAALPTSAFDDGFMLCFLDPGKYFKLKSVCDPYTINISVHGEITVTPGVTGLPAGSPAVTTDPFHVDPVPAPPAPPGTLNNPAIDTVDINPAPNAATLPSGADATVRKEQYVTFTVKASDANSDTLWCRWTAVKTRGAAGGTGGITPEEESRMEWNYSENKWNAVTEWRPPSDAVIGDQYTLTCTVIDRNGGTVTVAKVVEIVGGKIVYVKKVNGFEEIFIMNGDGSSEKQLTFMPGGGSNGNPCLSQDASKIAFVSDRIHTAEIFIMNVDGSDQKQLTDNSGENRYPSFSPDGKKIVWCSDSNPVTTGKSEICIMNTDGSDKKMLTDTGGGNPCFSYDGTKIAYDNNPVAGDGKDIYYIDANYSGPGYATVNQVTHDNGSCQNWSPNWTPDGRIVFNSNVDTGAGTTPCKEGCIINIDGSDRQNNITHYSGSGNGDVIMFCSPDSGKVLFSSDRSGKAWYLVNPDGTEPVKFLDIDGGGAVWFNPSI
ncbi:MAG: prepilin-type N-terminal cleavage/methylation domain-containing protein [Vulcanimicrobiota bacterium]